MTKTILVAALVWCSVGVSPGQISKKIDIQKSTVTWKGSNLFKFNEHSGTVNFKEGIILKRDGRIVGGDFTIDMNSIINTDGKYNKMLVSHLKGEDFFDVENFELSTLKILRFNRTSAQDVNIEAELTIKGVTNVIYFKSKLEVGMGKWKLVSKFFIDRTRWGIKYESKGWFGGVKDDIISDAIEFGVVLEWEDTDGGC